MHSLRFTRPLASLQLEITVAEALGLWGSLWPESFLCVLAVPRENEEEMIFSDIL